MTRIDLTPRLRAAADYMEVHGWTQNTERAQNGAVCMTGAVRHCSPPPGDFYLIRQVLRENSRAETWNDYPGRTQEQVVEALRTITITDVDLEEIYGPQWKQIVTLVRQTACLSEEQILALAAARYARKDTDRDFSAGEAWHATRVKRRSRNLSGSPTLIAVPRRMNLVERSARITVRDAAGMDEWKEKLSRSCGERGRDLEWESAMNMMLDAVQDAALALAVGHLISAENFGVLYGPWAAVFGPADAG